MAWTPPTHTAAAPALADGHHPPDGRPALPWPLLLASTSPYRRALLARLRLPFAAQAPEVDETALPGEPPIQQAQRLALAKAQAVAAQHPEAWVIGSDQVAELDGQAIGKPGHHAAAAAQLRAMAGRTVRFHTAVAVVRLASGFAGQALADVAVTLRPLSEAQIDRYLRLDSPYDCAGSAKVECLGIALAETITSHDPTALEGLPLIATCRLLREAGLDVLDWAR